MSLDTSIAMGYKPPQMPNQLANYAQMQQIMGAQQSQEASQMQLEKMKRDEASLSTMMQAITAKGGPSDPMEAASAMIKSGIPHYMDAGLKLQQAAQQQKQFASIMGGAPAAAPEAGGNALALTAPDNALAPNAEVSAMRAQRNKLLALGTTQGIAAARALDADIALASREPIYHNVPNVGLVDPRTQRVIMSSVEKSAAEPPDFVMMRKLGYSETPAGYQQYRDAQRQNRLLTPEELKQKLQVAAASRAPAQPRPEQPLEKVVDPVTGKIVFASREEALRGRMTPAAAMESLSPKEIQKREAALPQATSAVKGFESKSDKFIADLKALRDDPGLKNITGPVFGRTGSVSQAGSRAQALYDKVVAKGGFQALQDLRDASKTGGALGNVSNAEGKQLIASFSAIDRRQNAADVKDAIDQAISDIEGSKTRMREAYDSTYSYKSGGTSTPEAAPGKPAPASNIDALLNKYR
jgi:hypothetical protein